MTDLILPRLAKAIYTFDIREVMGLWVVYQVSDRRSVAGPYRDRKKAFDECARMNAIQGLSELMKPSEGMLLSRMARNYCDDENPYFDMIEAAMAEPRSSPDRQTMIEPPRERYTELGD